MMDCLLDSQTLLFNSGVLLLLGNKLPTIIGNWMFLTLLITLAQYSSYPMIGSIGLQDKLRLKIWTLEYRIRAQAILEALECLLTILAPADPHGCTLPCQVCQWCSQRCKVLSLDESSVVSCKSQECSHTSLVSWSIRKFNTPCSLDGSGFT